MYQRLTSENVLTYVCSFFFCTRKLLPLLLLCHLIAFDPLAQIKEDVLIEDSLVEYGSVIIPYKTEAEALTFEPASSTWVRELTWSKAVQQVISAAGKPAQVSVYTTSVETSTQWLGKEQFLVILAPKTSFTIEVNGYKKNLTSPGVNTHIRITPLLKAEGGATTIKVWSDKDTGDIDALAYKFRLMAAPDVRFATSRVRVFNTYPENYRGLNWSYSFRMKTTPKAPDIPPSSEKRKKSGT